MSAETTGGNSQASIDTPDNRSVLDNCLEKAGKNFLCLHLANFRFRLLVLGAVPSRQKKDPQPPRGEEFS
jgi:hypothetical protein